MTILSTDKTMSEHHDQPPSEIVLYCKVHTRTRPSGVSIAAHSGPPVVITVARWGTWLKYAGEKRR